MRHAFDRTNELQKEHLNAQRAEQREQKAHDKLDFFPFVSGELLENHQRGLN
jgi:hypothetical protein